jgi:hypothetical protein
MVMSKLQNSSVALCPWIYQILVFPLVIILLAVALSICQGLLILRVGLSLLKRQAKTTMDQDGKSFGLMKMVSSLQSQVSDLMAKIIHLEECDAFLIGIIESTCE